MIIRVRHSDTNIISCLSILYVYWYEPIVSILC